MIGWISTWAEQIIVAVIIATIIEMILPSGNNKKYIKAVIGVYIVFTIISPVISKFTKIDFRNIDYEKYFNELDTKQAMSQTVIDNNDKITQDIYINKVKQDMKLKLKQKGYTAENISININLEEENYGRINSIRLTLYKEESIKEDANNSSSISINKIEAVNIGNNISSGDMSNKKKLSNNDKNEIKEYLSSVYEISKEKININE